MFKVAFNIRRIILGVLKHIIVKYLRLLGSQIGENVEFTGLPKLRIHNFKNLIIESGTRIERGVVIWQHSDNVIHIGRNCYIGFGVILNSSAETGGGIRIGDGTLVGAYCLVQDNDHGMELGKPIREQAMTVQPIMIGANCWIGAHSCILKGVTIEEGSVVGANAVVNRYVAQNWIVAGVPAVPLKQRM